MAGCVCLQAPCLCWSTGVWGGGKGRLLFLVATVKVVARRGCAAAGWEAACPLLPLHYMWLTYFSSAKWRRAESWEEYRAKSQADSGPPVSGAGCVIA